MAINKSWKWLVALGAVFVPASLLAAVNIPYTFTAGTPIRSAEVNANFDALKTFVDTLETTLGGKADKPASGEYVASAGGRIAYAWVDTACSTSTLPNCALDAGYAYNPAGPQPTSTRTSIGTYTVTFPGLTGPNGGHAQVTAYGGGPRHCKVLGWGAPTVDVLCIDVAGNPVDSRFTVMLLF